MDNVGYCYVCADIFHSGHVKFLKKCKAKCQYLICGVLTNKAIERTKGKSPVMNYEERAAVVASCRYVNRVVKQKAYSPRNNYLFYQPDIIFESNDHNITMRYYKKITIFPYTKGVSSSAIKEKIRNS